MPSLLRLSVLPAVLGLLLGSGFFGSLFGRAEAPAVSPDAVAAVLDARLAGMDSLGRVLVAGQRVALHPATLLRYVEGEPLWTEAEDRAALAGRLAEAPLDGLPRPQVHADAVARLRAALADAAPPEGANEDDPRPTLLADLDLLLTDGLLRYADALLGRRVVPDTLYPGHWYPTLPAYEGTQRVATALAEADARTALDALDALRPSHPEYAVLRRTLDRLLDARAAWTAIPDGPPLAPGDASIRVPHLRSRLAALGYLGPGAPLNGWAAREPFRYDSSLALAVAQFQRDHRLPTDTLLDEAVTTALNLDPDSLLRTVALNLERLRWLADTPGDLHVLANLPAFELAVRVRAPGGGWRETLRQPAGIGRPNAGGWTTPILSDSIESVVFNPSWYVPTSIQAASLLPQAKADSGEALFAQGFSVWMGGGALDPRLVDWAEAQPGQYALVQRPGPGNPLGRVKFIMPNAHAVLIHDTNKPWHFDREVRTVSSGCVQASDARALALELLRARNGWDADRVAEAYRSGWDWAVPLQRPVPTHFVYFTAWPEADGRLRLYDDVYGYDALLAEALFGSRALAG